MSERSVRAGVWAIGVGCVLGACSTPRMQVPPDIAAKSEVLEVTDRSAWSGSLANEGFRLGPYAVTDVDRDWDSSSGFSVGGFSRETASGGYAYRFEGAGANFSGKCASAQRGDGVDLGGGVGLSFRFAKLACECQAGSESASVVVEGDGREYDGTVATSAGKHSIQSVHDLEGGGTDAHPTGYRMNGTSAVAAADVMRPGRVWLDKALVAPERNEVACLFAGLLLYQPDEEE